MLLNKLQTMRYDILLLKFQPNTEWYKGIFLDFINKKVYLWDTTFY